MATKKKQPKTAQPKQTAKYGDSSVSVKNGTVSIGTKR